MKTNKVRIIRALRDAMQNAVEKEFAKKENKALTSEDKEELVQGMVIGWLASYSVRNDVPIEELMAELQIIAEMIYALESHFEPVQH
jgi:hypothetical protein